MVSKSVLSTLSVPFEVVSFNTLLSGFANQGDVERACRLLLKDMPAAGVQPGPAPATRFKNERG